MKSAKPWIDWIPGVLSKAQISRLLVEGYIENGDPDGVDHSALDLRLSDEGYEMPKGCVKPFGERFLHFLQKDALVAKIAADANGHYTLAPRHTYLFKLKERISSLGGGQIWGLATAKSSVGRMDVLARLIVDGMYEYESFQPEHLKSGDLFLERR